MADMNQLHTLTAIPESFLEIDARNLYKIFDGPSLIHLPGKLEDVLFVSILQHGNEDTGLKAIQAVLKNYHNQELPRAMSLFVANISGARHGLRRLDGQADYNRAWPGTDIASCVETNIMNDVFEQMRNIPLFATVDIHNNTGLNPHYSVVCQLDQSCLQLATLFNRIVMYTEGPKGMLIQAFSKLCPAVVLECGPVGNLTGTSHASNYLEACLHMSHLPEHRPAEHDLDLFHTIGSVKLRETASIGFSDDEQTSNYDLTFPAEVDHLNFHELDAGTRFGKLKANTPLPLYVESEDGIDITKQFLVVDGTDLLLKSKTMPAMLTLNERVIRQDCLCYFMERYAR